MFHWQCYSNLLFSHRFVFYEREREIPFSNALLLQIFGIVRRIRWENSKSGKRIGIPGFLAVKRVRFDTEFGETSKIIWNFESSSQRN